MREKPRGTRGTGYIRVSREKATGGKSEEKTSPEAQKATVRAWCRRLGITEPSQWYMDVEGKNSRDTWDARDECLADQDHPSIANGAATRHAGCVCPLPSP